LTTLVFLKDNGLMDADLKSLEERVTKLIALCSQLRDENVELRQEVTRLHQESQSLKLNMTQASVQLERLLSALPEEGR
jgi:cell division protein ZapB